MCLPVEDGSGSIAVQVVIEQEAEGLPLPAYATAGSAGMDLMAALPPNSPLLIAPGQRALISTGLRISLPEGFEAQIRPRSGLAARYGIMLPNAPGTIDSDYRGTIQVLLLNAGSEPVTFQRGDRIAQLVIAPVVRGAWQVSISLPATQRDAGGFGSTGVAVRSPLP